MPHEPTTKSSTRHRIGVGLAAVLVLVAAASLTDDSRPAPPPASGRPATGQKPTSPVVAAGDDRSPRPSLTRTAVLPDLVGHGLQKAQDTAQAAGFSLPSSHDATGKDRLQIFDRHWRVCAQTPLPGTHPTATDVDLAVVKTDERCPS